MKTSFVCVAESLRRVLSEHRPPLNHLVASEPGRVVPAVPGRHGPAQIQSHSLLVSLPILALGLLMAMPAVLEAQSDAARSKPAPDAQSAANLQRKQEIQKRVRRMARQLVAGVIDIQLRQLEENGLQSHDWYRDIRAMRGHLDELVDAEMNEVVQLLTEIESGDPAQREAKFLKARQKSREVLIRLLVERQNLLRRLRISEMAAEVRRLIVMETRVQDITRSLPGQTQTRRETLALATVEDQRDIKEIYLRLKEVLREVAAWSGSVGAEASKGLELLKTHRVDEEMDAAGRHLEAAAFGDAEASQQKVIEWLRALLQVIERARGLIEQADRQAVQEALRDLADKQEQLREATSQADLANPESPQSKELVQKQQEIAKDIANMADQPSAKQPLQQAERAADRAAEQMFAGKQEEALAEQQKVMDNLAKAAKNMEAAQKAENREPAKPQAQQVVADLEGAKKDLEKILQEQEQASETAKTMPQEARKHQTQIARQLAEVPKNRRLPEPIAPRVKEAQQAAAEAAGQMSRPVEQRQTATKKAEQAIQRALSEVTTALADAQRRDLAMKVQELAKAAQARDQAAADDARKQMAKTAEQLAAMTEQQLKQAHEALKSVEQAAANQPAEQTAEKIDRLEQAEKAVRQAAVEQQRAAGRPEAAKATELAAGIQQAFQMQKQADRAAEAARDQQSPNPLEAIKPQRAVAQAVEKLAQQTPRQEAALKRAQQAAEKAVKEMLAAKPEQAQAARAEAKQALEEAHKMAAAELDRAMQAPAGKPSAPAQERVGRQIQQGRELSQSDAPEAAQTLDAAKKTSDQAQQQAAEANREAATKHQEATAQSLDKAARQLAEARQQMAEQAAPQFAQEAAEANRATLPAIPVAPGATAALQSAENQAHRAAQEVPQAPERARPAEEGVKQSLDMAAAEIAARQQQLAREQTLARQIASSPDAPSAMEAVREIAGQDKAERPLDRAADKAASRTSPGGGSKAPWQPGPKNQPTATAIVPEQDMPARDLRTPDSTQQTAQKGGRKSAEEPWMINLPPELRQAIRANAQHRPPRGYEERLQRYFQSVD